ncbi:MAG TPA: endonuclease/exonuclease/phosphatase family protein [Candidatus Saccharimonadales bacterium]
MKIIQANIWGGKLGQQIMDFLVREKPDFVCMQEVNDLDGRAGYKFFATLDEIKNGAGLPEAAMSASYASRYMERELKYGNAVLSRLPLASAKTVFTRGSYKHNFDVTKDDGNIRNLQFVTVKVSGRVLNILNHHGHHVPDSKAGNDETSRQMHVIADVIDSLDGPIILCGDFNLAPDSESLAIINGKLTNLSIKYGLKRTYNQFSAVNTVCDYIFVNDLVKVRHFAMSEDLISDHKALIMEFEL